MRTRSMFGSLHEFESEDFYKKIKYLKCNENEQYQNYFKEEYSPKLAETIYTCDMIICDFNEWIENGMK